MMKSQETKQSVKIDSCTTVIDVEKFLEISNVRFLANPVLNSSCKERTDKYHKAIKENGNHE